MENSKRKRLLFFIKNNLILDQWNIIFFNHDKE